MNNTTIPLTAEPRTGRMSEDEEDICDLCCDGCCEGYCNGPYNEQWWCCCFSELFAVLLQGCCFNDSS